MTAYVEYQGSGGFSKILGAQALCSFPLTARLDTDTFPRLQSGYNFQMLL
jgi:hypothetical protein